MQMLLVTVMLGVMGSGLAQPARQVVRHRVPVFKNFPVVGLKENREEEPSVAKWEEAESEVEAGPRDARQAEPSSYTEDLNLDSDLFVEEALYLTPADREARQLADQQDYKQKEDIEQKGLDGYEFSLEDEALDSSAAERGERDGLHGAHTRHGARAGRFHTRLEVPGPADPRGGRAIAGASRNNRVQPPQVVETDYSYEDGDYEDEDYEEYEEEPRAAPRRPPAAAIGLLNSPPSSKGDYNFK